MKVKPLLLLSSFLVLVCLTCAAKTVEYTLTIADERLKGGGGSKIVINGQSPGPTLYFNEGDTAIIHVHNIMSVATSVHWHGILLPNAMDGVPFLTYPPIKPGETFTYEFPIRQSGTYWYHSHSGLQEQRGLYGSIVIYPKNTSSVLEARADEKVVLLSDWTNENPATVMRTLRAGNDWYSIKKQSAQSLIGAIRIGMLHDYLKRELLRMPPMDIADVGYDAFFVNGEQEDYWPIKVDGRVRLRVINGSASSFFYLEYAGGEMTVVAADGIDVEPVQQNRILMGIAETYDIEVDAHSSGAHEFRATCQDNSGHASLWIGEGEKHYAPNIPFPNVYRMHGDLSWERIFSLTPSGSMGMSDVRVNAGDFDEPHLGMSMGKGMHGSMTRGVHEAKSLHSHDQYHPTGPLPPLMLEAPLPLEYMASDAGNHSPLVQDGSMERPWPPYEALRSKESTAFDSERPVREYRLTLDGDMERYVWLINNRPLAPGDTIRVKKGEIARFIMINRTMMHHPMHLHGHFYRVINGQGDFAPLKHTVDVTPMGTTVIEFDANDAGDWFFHCHNLYHMHTGMARVVHYDEFEPSAAVEAVRPNLYKDPFYLFGQGYLLTNMTSGFVQYSNTFNIFQGEWEYGFQDESDELWEGIATYSRSINRFFALFAGGDFVHEHGEKTKFRGVTGVSYLLPLNIDMRIWVDTDLGGRINLGKLIQFTPRVSLEGEVEYDTHLLWEGFVGLNFRLTKNLFLSARWHSEYKWGVGVGLIL